MELGSIVDQIEILFSFLLDHTIFRGSSVKVIPEVQYLQ